MVRRARARRLPGLLGRRWLEVSHPTANHALEALAIEAVVTASSGAPHLDDAGALEHVQVPCRRRPTVRKARGEPTRRKLAPEVAQEQNDVPPHLVAERRKHDVDLGE